jgi:cytidylate kinase
MPDFIMDVASCRGTGRTNVSNDISSLDALPHLYGIFLIVGIIGEKNMTVSDHNKITSASDPNGKDNDTILK